MTKEQSMTIIETISQQIGGGKALAMTGGSFIADTSKCRLIFKFKGSKKANQVYITYLEGADLYEMKFIKYSPSKMTVKEIETFDNVYAEDLISLFESTTGLYLSL